MSSTDNTTTTTTTTTTATATTTSGPGPLRKLLGVSNLIKGSKKSREDVPVASLEGKALLFLFSGEWCPSCRLFKTKLNGFYKRMKDAKKEFEIVYITQDRDEEEFERAFEPMPWLALPLKEKRSHTRLSSLCGIESVPTLVLVNPRGKIVTTDARRLMARDPDGDDFPWVPPTVFEVLDKIDLYTHDQRKIPFKDIPKQKEQGFALYFAASWVKPCRLFTPKLVTTYMKMREAGNNDFEIILVPVERDPEAFDDFWAEMPFPTIAPSSDACKKLREALGIGNVPTVVTVNSKTGEVVNRQAVPNIEEDVEGLRFPWKPKELPPMSRFYPSGDVVVAVQDNICVILHVNGAANKNSILQEFSRAAVLFDAQKNSEMENSGDKVRFFTVDAEDAEKGFLMSVLRALSLKAPVHGQASLVLFCLLNQDKQLIPAANMNSNDIFERVELFRKRQVEELGDKELNEMLKQQQQQQQDAAGKQ